MKQRLLVAALIGFALAGALLGFIHAAGQPIRTEQQFQITAADHYQKYQDALAARPPDAPTANTEVAA